MAIIGSLPSIILNGQLVDAPPVMADLLYIQSQVNANVPALIPTSVNGVPIYIGTVGGTSNAITLTPSIPATSYVAGLTYSFTAQFDNGAGSATVNVSGLGTKPLVNAVGQAMTGGEMKAGGDYIIQYDGTNFQLMNGGQGSGIVNWTPTVTFGGAGVGVTYSRQVGLFFKIGQLCLYSFDVVLTSKGSSTGGIAFNGMPTFSSSPNTCNGGFVIGLTNVTWTGQVSAGVNPGTNAALLFKFASGGSVADVQDSDCANNSEFLVSGFFT